MSRDNLSFESLVKPCEGRQAVCPEKKTKPHEIHIIFLIVAQRLLFPDASNSHLNLETTDEGNIPGFATGHGGFGENASLNYLSMGHFRRYGFFNFHTDPWDGMMVCVWVDG